MMKRLFDVVASAAGLVVLAPLLVAIAVVVALDSGFPVFFGHRRVGRNFREFRLWKFRSMQLRNSGPSITVRGDPRVTTVGRFLRATKLDELPQLWNVLRGDMSLVGPRPEVAEYVNLMRDRYSGVLRVRPGITDPASIRFRYEEAELAQAIDPVAEYCSRILPEKLAIAEAYVLNRTFAGDLRILIDTVTATLNLR